MELDRLQSCAAELRIRHGQEEIKLRRRPEGAENFIASVGY